MRVHHLAFRTRRLTELEAFYVEALNLVVLRRDHGRSVWLAAGETVLMLELAGEEEPAPPAHSLELVAFAMSQTEQGALEKELGRRQIAIESRTRFTVYFRDPDGRRIGVSSYEFPDPTVQNVPWFE
jgi:catechol-2,3-dioxygenase